MANLRKEHAKSKVVAIMSMSLDGYVAELNDGVAEVFDWYFTSGDVEVHTGGSDPMTFHVSQASADHLHGLIAELGAMLTGRRTFDQAEGWSGNHAWGPAFAHPSHPRRVAAPRLDCPLRDRRYRKRREPGQDRRRREECRSPRRGHHPAITECRAPR